MFSFLVLIKQLRLNIVSTMIISIPIPCIFNFILLLRSKMHVHNSHTKHIVQRFVGTQLLVIDLETFNDYAYIYSIVSNYQLLM